MADFHPASHVAFALLLKKVLGMRWIFLRSLGYRQEDSGILVTVTPAIQGGIKVLAVSSEV